MNVAWESKDESGIFGSGADSELELSPLAGTPMPPWLKAFPRPGGSNRGSLFFIFAWLGRNLNRRTRFKGQNLNEYIPVRAPMGERRARESLKSATEEQAR
jgi:hypothetical protein